GTRPGDDSPAGGSFVSGWQSGALRYGAKAAGTIGRQKLRRARSHTLASPLQSAGQSRNAHWLALARNSREALWRIARPAPDALAQSRTARRRRTTGVAVLSGATPPCC